MIDFSPHPYQGRAIEWCMDKPKCALWMEMGLGKTVATLTALAELLDTFQSKRVLVVAPLRVCRSVWPVEIAKWSHTQNLAYSLLLGNSIKRDKALRSRAPIHIINYDNLVWLVKHVLTITGGRWPYDTVIVDESSFVKHQSSKRFKALRHVSRAIERMVQLTGSPADNGLMDLWAQLYLLDNGERLGMTEKAMRDRWFEPVHQGDYGPTWVPRPGAPRQIHERVSDIALSLRAKDYLDMPDLVVRPVWVDMPPTLQHDYNQLERQMWIELGGQHIEAVNGGVLTGKCRQFTNGFLYDEDHNVHRIHTLKLNALEEVITEAAGRPVLVGYQFIEDVTAIKERFREAVVLDDDPATVDAWNAGRIPMLLAHPKSAGHGLNLQAGGEIIAFYGLDWSLQLYEQMVARLHRQGQTRPVFVYPILARNTVDELVLMRLEDKDRSQTALKDAVHRYQQKRGLKPC